MQTNVTCYSGKHRGENMKKPEFKIIKDYNLFYKDGREIYAATVYCVNCNKKVQTWYYEVEKDKSVGENIDIEGHNSPVYVDPSEKAMLEIYFEDGCDQPEVHFKPKDLNWPVDTIKSILEETFEEHDKLITETDRMDAPGPCYCSEDCLGKYIRKKLKEKITVITRSTALAAITALRQFNHLLKQQKKDYQSRPDHGSFIESVEQFQERSKKAFDELQKGTSDTTPWEIKT